MDDDDDEEEKEEEDNNHDDDNTHEADHGGHDCDIGVSGGRSKMSGRAGIIIRENEKQLLSSVINCNAILCRELLHIK